MNIEKSQKSIIIISHSIPRKPLYEQLHDFTKKSCCINHFLPNFFLPKSQLITCKNIYVYTHTFIRLESSDMFTVIMQLPHQYIFRRILESTFGLVMMQSEGDQFLVVCQGFQSSWNLCVLSWDAPYTRGRATNRFLSRHDCQLFLDYR